MPTMLAVAAAVRNDTRPTFSAIPMTARQVATRGLCAKVVAWSSMLLSKHMGTSGDFVGNRSSTEALVLDGCRTAEIMLIGCVDRRADALLYEALEELLIDPQVQRIEVDVALVDYCDFGGLTVFLRARRRAANFGVPLRLTQTGPLLHHVLETAGLEQLLTSA
jgi:anti-anti-sigma factor